MKFVIAIHNAETARLEHYYVEGIDSEDAIETLCMTDSNLLKNAVESIRPALEKIAKPERVKTQAEIRGELRAEIELAESMRRKARYLCETDDEKFYEKRIERLNKQLAEMPKGDDK